DRLDNAGDDFASAVLELFKLTLALSIANFLEDHLLGALRIDAAEIDRWQRVHNKVPDGRAGLQLLSLLQINLLEVVFDHFNHVNHTPQAQITGQRVELRTDVVFCAISRTGGLLDRLFHRFDDDRLIDHLFRSDRMRDRKQFSLVGGNRTGHQSSAFSSSRVSSISSTPPISSGRVAAISLSVRTSLAD